MIDDVICADIPEYGAQVRLVKPWRGYRRGVIMGQFDDCRYAVLLSCGSEIALYRDEFEIDS